MNIKHKIYKALLFIFVFNFINLLYCKANTLNGDDFPPRVAYFIVNGNKIIASDPNNKEIWSVSFEEVILDIEVCDLNGDNNREIVIGTASKRNIAESFGEKNGKIYLLNAENGDSLWNEGVNGGIEKVYENFDDKYSVYDVHVADINGDNLKDIIALCAKNPWYPTRVLVILGTGNIKNNKNRWNYFHPGAIRLHKIIKRKNNNHSLLIFGGVNNHLGSKAVIFALIIENPGDTGQAPSWKARIGTPNSEKWYTLLGCLDIPDSLRCVKNGNIRFKTALKNIYYIDLFGNILNDSLGYSSDFSHALAKGRHEILLLWKNALKLLNQNDNEMSIRTLQKVISKAEELQDSFLLSTLFWQLGEFHYTFKQYDKAIESYNKALHFDNKYYGCFIGIGKCHKMKAEYNKAIYYLEEKALEYFKARWQAHWIFRDIMECYILSGAIDKSKKLILPIKELDNRWISYSSIGDMFLIEGKFKKAIEVYEECLSQKEFRVDALSLISENLAKAYAYWDSSSIEDLYKANKLIKERMRSDTESDSSLSGTLGWIKYQIAKKGYSVYSEALNEVNKAILYYEKRIETEPIYELKLAELYFFYANIVNDIGNIVQAQEYIDKCQKYIHDFGDSYYIKVKSNKFYDE